MIESPTCPGNQVKLHHHDHAGHPDRVTQLSLISAADPPVWRCAKQSYGALNPLQVDSTRDRRVWSRFDVQGARTAYAGSTQETAYAETLAYFAVPERWPSLGELFPESDSGDDTSVLEAVAEEWADGQHMPLRSVSAGFRFARRIYEILLPPKGWFVDVHHPQTLSALSRYYTEQRRAQGVDEGVAPLTTADLTGEDRNITTRLAEHIQRTVLFDGSEPHGIVYDSKYGSGMRCWAIWLRATDIGQPELELTRIKDSYEIKHRDHNPALAQAANLLNLTCH